jgi:hypothetical protein
MSGDDTEKKRKHDNILTTEEESDDEDLVNMDLKNYISDEDPDYEVIIFSIIFFDFNYQHKENRLTKN